MQPTKVAILLIALVALCPAKIDGAKFDDELREFVEFLRLQMQCGYPAAGIPPLAPYQADYKEFDWQASTVEVKANFSNLVISGLNEFDVVALSWNNVLQKVSFDFKFPSVLVVAGNYKADAHTRLKGSPLRIFGDGTMSLELVNLRAYGSFKLRPSLSGDLQMWSFKVQLELEETHSKSTGVMNSRIYTKLFNDWVEEFVKLIINDNVEDVSALVKSIAEPPLNSALSNISMLELVALIMGIAGDVIPNEAMC